MPEDHDDDEQPAHRRRAFLDVVGLRALLADALAEAERLEQPDVRRHEDDDEGEGQEQALDELDGHRSRGLAELEPQGVDEPVEPDPARRLDQDGVAVAQARAEARRARPRRRRRDGSGRRPGPASSAPSAMPRGVRPDDDEQLDVRPRRPRRPPRGPPRGRRRARASRRARRRGGRAARPAGRARRPPTRARRCSCRRRPSRRAAGRRSVAVRRAPAAGAGRRRSRRGRARRRAPTAAAGQRVVDRQAPERRDGRRRARPTGVRSRKRIPSSPAMSTASARTSASSREAVAQGPGRGPRVHPRDDRVVGVEDRPCRPAGSASSSSPLACSTASSEPMRDRWTGWTAVTTPIDGRPMAARSAISPPTYMPISRTAASCSGPSRRTVSGRPISLFWLPSVFAASGRRAEDRGDGLLGRGLGDAPRDADDERVEPRRQPAATAPSAASASATRMTVTSPSAVRRRPAAGSTSTAAAPRRIGVGEVGVAVGPLAGQGHEQLPGRRPAGSRRRRRGSVGRSGRASRPPVRRDQVVGRQGGRAAGPSSGAAVGDRRRSRRPVSHGRAHRSRRPGIVGTGRSSSRSGVVMASVAMRRNSSNDIDRHLQLADPGDRRRALLDADGDDEVRACPLARDVSDERVVEEVVLPARPSFASRPRSGRCRSCRRRGSRGRASGRGRTGPRR